MLLNLLALSAVHPHGYVYFSRQRSYYSGKPISYDHFMKVVAGLEQFMVVTTETGKWSPVKKYSLRSRIHPTERLTSLFREYRLSFHHIQSTRHIDSIELRNPDKSLKPLPTRGRNCPRIQDMRDNLELINDRLRRTFIGLNVTDEQLKEVSLKLSANQKPHAIDFSRKTVYRIFNNGSFDRGGRFYGGWWQWIPSALRQEVMFGIPGSTGPSYTREFDFQSMLPAIAYAKEGMDPPDDCYSIDICGVERKVLKLLMLSMLNTTCRKDACLAVHNAMRNSGASIWEDWAVEEADFEELELPALIEIADELEYEHRSIGSWLYRERGLELMKIESDIAEHALVELANNNITALPVHDSFLTASKHADDLVAAMTNAFRVVTGGDCRLTPEPIGSRDNWAAKKSVCRSLYNSWRHLGRSDTTD